MIHQWQACRFISGLVWLCGAIMSMTKLFSGLVRDVVIDR